MIEDTLLRETIFALDTGLYSRRGFGILYAAPGRDEATKHLCFGSIEASNTCFRKNRSTVQYCTLRVFRKKRSARHGTSFFSGIIEALRLFQKKRPCACFRKRRSIETFMLRKRRSARAPEETKHFFRNDRSASSVPKKETVRMLRKRRSIETFMLRKRRSARAPEETKHSHRSGRD